MRLSRLILAALFVGVVGLLPAAQPVPQPELKSIALPDGTSVRVVNRDKMRMKGAKKFALPAKPLDLPPAPAAFDYTKTKSGTAIAFPMLGNDQYGDCFYVAPAHYTQSIVAYSTGSQIAFDKTKLVNRYLKISGGDNGLSDDDIFPEWENGIVGPGGPYKILDYATIDPADPKSVKAAFYHLGGGLTTHSLRTTWEANIRPGMVWTNDGRIDPNAGHAVHQAGVNPDGTFKTITWGMEVKLTESGLANSDAEVIVVVAKDWFDAKGYTPNGTHYDDVAKFWLAGTGRKLPQGLFPPAVPDPPKPPTPPNPPLPPVGGLTGTETTIYAGGRIVSRSFVPGTVAPTTPNVNADTHKIDLAPHLAHIVSERRRERVRARVIAAVSDHDGVDVKVNGDEITLTRKVGFDPNKWLDFLTKLMPFILQLIALFGGA